VTLLRPATFAALSGVVVARIWVYGIPLPQISDQPCLSSASFVDDGVDAAMDRYAVVPPSSELVAQQAWIDECYDGETEAFFARSHVLGRELCR
jgi:hypothetical protein